MNGKIKIAHVISQFNYGGAEVLLRELFHSEGFRERLDSDLIIGNSRNLELLPQIDGLVNNIYTFDLYSGKMPFEYVKMLRLIRKNKYEIVHVHLPLMGWLVAFAKKLCPKTIFIYTEHNLFTHHHRLHYYMNGFTYGMYDSIISCGYEVFYTLEKVQKSWFYKTKNHVALINGINTDKFDFQQKTPDSSRKLIVGLVAMFRRQKRIDRWVEVAEAVHKKSDNIRFLLIGADYEEEKIKEMVKEKGLTEVIEMPGQLYDTVASFHRMDIFLMTSDFEGLPLSLLEAMSSGCVPIVSNVGGIKQLEFDDFGYKFDGFDAEKIADKIISLSENYADFAEQSKKAHDFVLKNYSLKNQVNKTLELYDMLLNARKENKKEAIVK